MYILCITLYPTEIDKLKKERVRSAQYRHKAIQLIACFNSI